MSEIPSPPMTPYSSSFPSTLYTCIQYTYSHREGGMGGGELIIEKIRGAKTTFMVWCLYSQLVHG
jgi:hypothetical protein